MTFEAQGANVSSGRRHAFTNHETERLDVARWAQPLLVTFLRLCLIGSRLVVCDFFPRSKYFSTLSLGFTVIFCLFRICFTFCSLLRQTVSLHFCVQVASLDIECLGRF